MTTVYSHTVPDPVSDPCIDSRNAGFTLIEILVALAIGSIILIMAYASYRSIFDTIKRSTGLSEFYENVNLALLSIDRDLSNAYFTRSNKNISFICESDSSGSKLNFVTVNHNDITPGSNPRLSTHDSDIKEVGYFLREDKNTQGLSYLIKREKINYWEEDPLSGGTENILLPNVVSLKFEFNRGNDWDDTWDSRQNNNFPKAVKTTLVVKNYQAHEVTFEFVSLINIREFR